MSKKFLYVDVDGVYTEANSFETTDFVTTSTANSPILLDGSGLIPTDMIDASGISHSGLSNLSADDHTQYTLADGTRDFTGIVQYSSHPAFSADTDIVDKKYVDDLVSGTEWQDSVITRTATPPGSPSTGDRYLVTATASGAWVGQEDSIAEYNGSTWGFTAPTTGTYVSVDDESDGIYLYDGSAWTKKNFESSTASNGLTKIGLDIQVNPTLAGDGLAFSTGVMSVNVDDSSIEIDTDTLRVKTSGITNDMLNGSISDDKLVEDYVQTDEFGGGLEWSGTQAQIAANGVNDTHIDFGLGLNQVSAADIPVQDAGGFTTQTELEGVTQELYGLVAARGVEYTVGTGGCTKGDLMYISANDTVSTYTAITSNDRALGPAFTTESAAGTVKVLANDTQLEGAISGATFGDVYYWDGSSLTTSIPTGTGSYVWQAGIAVNATTLHIETKLIKKNL